MSLAELYEEGCIAEMGGAEDASSAALSPEFAALPNLITIAGFSLSIGWLSGGPSWMAFASLAADELDGRCARALGATSELGSLLDWTSDVVLSSLILQKLDYAMAIPPMLFAQILLRNQGWRPPIGSARALLTLYALYKEGGKDLTFDKFKREGR